MTLQGESGLTRVWRPEGMFECHLYTSDSDAQRGVMPYIIPLPPLDKQKPVIAELVAYLSTTCDEQHS